ncbi:DUF6577 family protein [uncultured Mucilaginibacter sp.]|uniref:DUF6577 family protein n=1 Tax=uncultured Mucilaginibacter sp. TaxID=797541 RepID=UPI002606EC94|nr:DUF6577 family protein [uncultured Mucilaginibacter sp.]
MAIFNLNCRKFDKYISTPIKKKVNISSIKERFGRFKPIGLDELYRFFKESEPDLLKSTFNWRVFELVKQFELKRIGRGQLMIGQEVSFSQQYTEQLNEIGSYIQDQFPFADYCLWDTGILNEFAHHLQRHSFIIVDVEKDTAQSVYFQLKERFKPAFFRVNVNLVFDFADDDNKPLLIRNMVSESPVSQGSIKTPTLEKILVDVFSDPEFLYLEGSEMRLIFLNAFEKYTINRTKLYRYAARKGKKHDLMEYIDNILKP